MAGKADEKKKKELIKKMQKARGYMLGPWLYLTEKDVGFMEAYNNLYERGLTDGKALPAKIREFIAIGILAYEDSRTRFTTTAREPCASGPPNGNCWRPSSRP
jgi:hypothetical protein